MKKRKVLICGASGFIGRNLFEHYDAGNEYETHGSYFKNQPKTLNSKIFQADLRNKEEALEITKNMDIVINAAALTAGIGVFSEMGKAEEFRTENNKVNENLAEAAHINKVKHFIFLSCTVMYSSSNTSLTEDEVDREKIHPKYSVVAEMKLFGEDRCRYYAGLGSTKYTAVRHSNIYGPHDKFDLKRGHVLAATITKIMEAKNQITVWGQGNESRDFLYIDDLINFIKMAIEKQRANFEIFNVGYGKTISINELVQKIIFCSGKKLEIVHDLQKPSIETHMNIDVEKAKQLLGWKAEVGLSEGLVRTLDWYHNSLTMSREKR